MQVRVVAADELSNVELGEWLARWRGFCFLTLKTVERQTGIPAGRLSRAESGDIVLSPSEKFVLLDYLGCELRKALEYAEGRVFIPEPLADRTDERLIISRMGEA
jgi:hypothetical protein